MNSTLLLHIAAPALLLAVVPAPSASRHDLRTLPDTGRYVLATEGVEARYRVREQLAGINLPSDAIGKTSKVEGQIVVDPKGAIVRDLSKFTVDATSLVSDSDRRDGYIQRNTLATAQYTSFVFVPTEFRNLRFPLPASGNVTFQMVGELTVRDQTKPITWDVTAKVEQGGLTGQATTKFTFADFALTKPRVRSVLSVEDDIKLELDFRLMPADSR
ncbi:MAG: YceI family protein [Longimicrobiales bacterium]